MSRDANGRFDDYSISVKIRETLLDWGCELVESDLLLFAFLLFFAHIKTSYYSTTGL